MMRMDLDSERLLQVDSLCPRQPFSRRDARMFQWEMLATRIYSLTRDGSIRLGETNDIE